MLAGAPFDGPIGEVRVGRVDGQFIVNPTLDELEESDVNLVVAGKQDAIVMVEGEMDEITEEEMVEALEVAHDAIRKIVQAQHDLIRKVNPAPMEYKTDTTPQALIDKVHDLIGGRMADHVRPPYEKQSFYAGISDLKDQAVEMLLGKDDPSTGETQSESTPEGWTRGDIRDAVGAVQKKVMRKMIAREKRRLDGRGLSDVRDIWCETSYLPRVHGSSIFTRGETQVLASVTLGTSKDVQAVDQIFDQEDKRFYLHYNFPPFCVGEARFLRGPGRREIGHGMLAERAIMPLLPSDEEFPYSIRVNADVLESNGSSSMASVCSGSMALMDAGVPLRKAVAGVAMGLIQEGPDTVVLTDILGTEDHLGDMDFKITGTRDGVTACQMDIKISGLSRELMLKALRQARDARHEILDHMDRAIGQPRQDLSPHAPRLTQITIDSDLIGAVIGPGGKVIKGIQADTDTQVDIEERDGYGYITIASSDAEGARQAVDMIKAIVSVPEVGDIYEGTVRSLRSFGAIIEIAGGKEGLLHISEVDHGYVEKVEDYMQVGDKVKVKLIEIRDGNKLRFSRKEALPESGNGQDRGGRN
jgi:polyribonucleotide nucleotidyltransferase